LLVDSLRWLRDQGLLDAVVLECLPLDKARFESMMFRGLFEVVRNTLIRENLLPAHDDGYVSTANGLLARTHELRNLFESMQLKALYGETRPLTWLDGHILQYKAPKLRKYLIYVLGMKELTRTTLLQRLNRPFLENQSDE